MDEKASNAEISSAAAKSVWQISMDMVCTEAAQGPVLKLLSKKPPAIPSCPTVPSHCMCQCQSATSPGNKTALQMTTLYEFALTCTGPSTHWGKSFTPSGTKRGLSAIYGTVVKAWPLINNTHITDMPVLHSCIQFCKILIMTGQTSPVCMYWRHGIGCSVTQHTSDALCLDSVANTPRDPAQCLSALQTLLTLQREQPECSCTALCLLVQKRALEKR